MQYQGLKYACKSSDLCSELTAEHNTGTTPRAKNSTKRIIVPFKMIVKLSRFLCRLTAEAKYGILNHSKENDLIKWQPCLLQNMFTANLLSNILEKAFMLPGLSSLAMFVSIQ